MSALATPSLAYGHFCIISEQPSEDMPARSGCIAVENRMKTGHSHSAAGVSASFTLYGTFGRVDMM